MPASRWPERFDLDWYHGRLKRLGPGDRHHPHVDAVAIPQARKLSAVAMLSDPGDFEGGALSVDFGTVQPLDLERGAIVVMPTWVLHGVEAVTQGERITAVVSGYGPAFR